MLLSTSQAARRLELSVDRVRQLAQRGVLTVAVRSPLGQLFEEAAVDQLAEVRRHGRAFVLVDDQPVQTA